ncbi:hypothetical protein KP509_38G018700 [Ceratopteris richardii]|uniref:Uncharacterized protein n=1 Tax=Ceratopteris richardii TaxID=49495 RepID=A0A8T2Q2T9_CERRI|nr:hypothetical protein KP509_38G018700 [Ceratopteris richardii]
MAKFAGCYMISFKMPKEFHQPKSRVVIRFLLTLLVCLISVSLVLLFLFTQEPTFRTVRHWDDTYALKQFSPFLASRNASLDPIYKEKSAATICPCSNTTFTWNSFVDFFTIQYNPPQNPVRSSMITNGTEFCLNSIKSLPLNSSHVSRVGCPNMVNAAVNKANSRTFLSSASLMDPVLLNSTIQRSVLENLQRSLNECVYAMDYDSTWNTTLPFEWLRYIYEAFAAMVETYGSNPHVSDLEFWNVANATIPTTVIDWPFIQMIDSRSALGMQVNWTRYASICRPLYCDVVEGVSVGKKIFSAMAEIGGFGALMLLIVRKLLWPSICMLAGWKQ